MFGHLCIWGCLTRVTFQGRTRQLIRGTGTWCELVLALRPTCQTWTLSHAHAVSVYSPTRPCARMLRLVLRPRMCHCVTGWQSPSDDGSLWRSEVDSSGGGSLPGRSHERAPGVSAPVLGDGGRHPTRHHDCITTGTSYQLWQAWHPMGTNNA